MRRELCGSNVLIVHKMCVQVFSHHTIENRVEKNIQTMALATTSVNMPTSLDKA
mgnify:CR=1 FL=1